MRHTHHRARSTVAPAAVLLALLVPAVAWPQAAPTRSGDGWPAKPVKIVVPFPAGGGTDVTARFLAQKFSEMWAQAVVVENKPGAGGNIGADAVAKSKPDGYILLMMPSNLSVNPSLFEKTPWDPVKDFTPIGTVATSPIMVGVNAAVPANSVRELIALAKAQPGKLNYISCGAGSPQHVAGELFNKMAGVQMQHVPYKGCGAAIPDAVAGVVQVLFSTVANMSPHIKTGRLKGFAVAGAKRSQLVPEVPTVSESGLPGYDFDVWFGLLAPADTPKDIIVKVNRDLNAVLAQKDVQERLHAQFYDVMPGTPEQFAALIEKDYVRFGKIIREVGIKPD
jgi:tripartite-type tricarboxylate transporter receptor subunit TctC